MTGNISIEISINGKWRTVPSMSFGGKSIVVNGRYLRVASVHDEEWLETELENPERCIERLKSADGRHLTADILTFAQKLPETTLKYDYRAEWDSVAAIKLSPFAEWWEKRLPQETRKNVRRAAKRGVTTVIRGLGDDLISGIIELNNESPTRQGRAFPHYGKSWDQVKKDYSTFEGRSDYVCAYVGEELIGFSKIIYCGPTAAMLQLMTKSSHYDKRPANALVAKAAEHCASRGCSFLVYGKYKYGNQMGKSLQQFKARNGFDEILVPRYYAPLTLKGVVGLKLNLHRDLVSMLPEQAVEVGRRVRRRWYTRNHKPV